MQKPRKITVEERGASCRSRGRSLLKNLRLQRRLRLSSGAPQALDLPRTERLTENEITNLHRLVMFTLACMASVRLTMSELTVSLTGIELIPSLDEGSDTPHTHTQKPMIHKPMKSLRSSMGKQNVRTFIHVKSLRTLMQKPMKLVSS